VVRRVKVLSRSGTADERQAKQRADANLISKRRCRNNRMKRSFLGHFALLLLMAASAATGQSTSLHQQIEPTYNFQPHSLSNQEITQKSPVLDQFWQRAKAEQSRYVPALRQELADFKNPPFFLYDGSLPLLSLSNTPPD
jgi:hypothetical protein